MKKRLLRTFATGVIVMALVLAPSVGSSIAAAHGNAWGHFKHGIPLAK